MTLTSSLLKIVSSTKDAVIVRALTTVLVAICLISSAARADWVGDARPKMGTEVSVYFWHDDPHIANEALEAVFAEMDRINRDIPQLKLIALIDTSRYIKQSISNMGIAILLALFTLLRSVYPPQGTTGYYAMGFVHSVLNGVWISLGAPWLFGVLKL